MSEEDLKLLVIHNVLNWSVEEYYANEGDGSSLSLSDRFDESMETFTTNLKEAIQ